MTELLTAILTLVTIVGGAFGATYIADYLVDRGVAYWKIGVTCLVFILTLLTLLCVLGA